MRAPPPCALLLVPIVPLSGDSSRSAVLILVPTTGDVKVDGISASSDRQGLTAARPQLPPQILTWSYPATRLGMLVFPQSHL